MGSFRLLSRLALVLAFVPGLLLLANARPLEEASDFEAGTGRDLLCVGPTCNTYDPQCNYVDLSGVCYFSPAMLKLPSTVTAYYCGPACPSTPQRYGKTLVQQKCPTIACGSTIGSVIGQGNGCASAFGYVNGLATSQTKALYYNADGSWINAQFKSFCLNPTYSQLTAVASMLAEGLATAQAKAAISGIATVCGCCDGTEAASQSISVYTGASATAVVQAVAQAITGVFDASGDCANAAILAEAPGFASALSQDVITITNDFYKQISLSKVGDKNFFNQVCNSASVPWYDLLKVKYANAYACAVTTVLSQAYNTGPYLFPSQNGTDTAAVCAENYAMAWSSDWPSQAPPSCKGACACPSGGVFQSNPSCPAGVKICSLPVGGSCSN